VSTATAPIGLLRAGDLAPRPASRPAAPGVPETSAGGSLGRNEAKRRPGLEILLVWTIVGLCVAAQRYLRGPSLQPRMALPWGASLVSSLLSAYAWALLTPAAMRMARRLRPRGRDGLWKAPVLLAGGAVLALVHLTATNALWHVIDPAERSADFVAAFLATLAFGGAARLATFAGIVGVTWGIDDYRTYRQTELQASELERELVQTELEALKLRLHPPFLFNALDAIRSLIRTEPRAAARTVVQLGDILRLSLYKDATELVPLRTEVEYVRLYLQIEQTRLEDRLEVRFSVDPDALNAAVPNLILLPLAESAVANGVAARPGRASVEIRARVEGDSLQIDVLEAAVEPPSSPSPPIDDSLVRRTRTRLELLYPGRHEVRVLSAAGRETGHCVSLTLPLETRRRAGRALIEGAA
jgi:two-component system LytT family sensor kinase